MKDAVIFESIEQLTEKQAIELSESNIFEDEAITNSDLILYQLTQGRLFFPTITEFTNLITKEIGFVNAEDDGYDSYRLIKRVIESYGLAKNLNDEKILKLLKEIQLKIAKKFD